MSEGHSFKKRARSLRRARHSFTSERRVRRAFSKPRFEDDDSGELRDGLIVGAACGGIGGVLLIGMIGVACLGYSGSGDGTLRPPNWRAAAPVALFCPLLGMLIGALVPWARTPARQIALTTLGTLPFFASLALLDGGIDRHGNNTWPLSIVLAATFGVGLWATWRWRNR